MTAADDDPIGDARGSTIGEAEIQAHLTLARRAVESRTPDERRAALVDGLLDFGDRFVTTCQQLATMAEGLPAFQESAEQVLRLFVGWMKGLDLTTRADERDRRALAGLRLIESRPDLVPLWSYAATAILALPEGHRLRDADAARTGVRTAVRTFREAGDDAPWALAAHAVRVAYGERCASDEELIAWDAWVETIGHHLDPEDGVKFWGAIEGYYIDRAGEDGPSWLEAADRARRHIDRTALTDEDRAYDSLLLVRRALVVDDQRQAADLLRQALEGGGLTPAVQRRAAVKEARVRLAHQNPARVIALLEPRIDDYEVEYVTAIADDTREAMGRDYTEACVTLAFARAQLGHWDTAIEVLERGKCARQRHRRALRRSPEGRELLELEADLYAMARGLPVPDRPGRPRTSDWLGGDVTPEAALQERYRRALPLLDPLAWRAPMFSDIQQGLRDGEAALSLGLSWAGLFAALVSGSSSPCLFTMLRPDLTDAVLAAPLADTREQDGHDGFLIALERAESEPDQRHALERALAFFDEVLGRPVAAAMREHGLQRLVVLPHHFLRLAPLWALPAWHDLDVRMAPAAFALAAGGSAPTLAGRALIVSNPTLDLPLASLEGVVTAARLSEAGLEVRTVSGQAATEEAVTGALEQVTVLHFAGHGHVALTDGSRSALVVSPRWSETPVADARALVAMADTPGTPHLVVDADEGSPHRKIYLEYARRGTLFAETNGDDILVAGELWRAGDILVQGTLEGCALAFLCACSSGLGSIEALDEATGLPAALDLAGVRTVISTGWPVQDALSVLFADEFYARALATSEGVSIDLVSAARRAAATLREMNRAEALDRLDRLARMAPDSRARFRLRAFAARVRGGPERPFAHPFDWGAFHLTGVAEAIGVRSRP